MTDIKALDAADLEVLLRALISQNTAAGFTDAFALAKAAYTLGTARAKLAPADGAAVERVARAISTYTYATTEGHSDCLEWEDMRESDRNTYRRAASAALAAMREGSRTTQLRPEFLTSMGDMEDRN